MKTIILFGSTGMLGRYIYSYFLKMISSDKLDWNIICINRNEYNVLNDNFQNVQKSKLKTILCNNMDKNNNDEFTVINAIGLIPQTKNENVGDYFKINTSFPHALDKLSIILNYKLIHITTDCVYNGSIGDYNELSETTETNCYGVSKSLGDALQYACIIRTSIIGEQDPQCTYKSLLDWVKMNDNNTISGYNNHIWNGMTCLKLSQIIFNIIKYKLYWNGIRHFFSNTVTKYELIQMIIKAYNLNINLIETQHVLSLDKTLSTVYITNNALNSFINNKNLQEQIIEQKQFNINQYYNTFNMNR
jgi:dTDP-4-dehydrorhamnose reductase